MLNDITYGTGGRSAGDIFTLLGEQLGANIADLIGTVRARTVTIADIDDNFAYVYIFEDTDEALPIPLTFMNIPGGTFKKKPA